MNQLFQAGMEILSKDSLTLMVWVTTCAVDSRGRKARRTKSFFIFDCLGVKVAVFHCHRSFLFKVLDSSQS